MPFFILVNHNVRKFHILVYVKVCQFKNEYQNSGIWEYWIKFWGKFFSRSMLPDEVWPFQLAHAQLSTQDKVHGFWQKGPRPFKTSCMRWKNFTCKLTFYNIIKMDVKEEMVTIVPGWSGNWMAKVAVGKSWIAIQIYHYSPSVFQISN